MVSVLILNGYRRIYRIIDYFVGSDSGDFFIISILIVVRFAVGKPSISISRSDENSFAIAALDLISAFIEVF